MLLAAIGVIGALLAIAIVVRGIWHIVYTYPHMSEKKTNETLRLLTEAEPMEKLHFFVNETKTTHMLFPRNMNCKGSHADLNLPRYNSVLLSGDIFFLEFLLQKGIYKAGFLVSNEIGRPHVYPAKSVPESPSIDLNEFIKRCPEHVSNFQSLLMNVKYQFENIGKDAPSSTGTSSSDIFSKLQYLFDFAYGIKGASDSFQLIEGGRGQVQQLAAAFRAEVDLLHKEQSRFKYSLWNYYSSGDLIGTIRGRMMEMSKEICALCQSKGPSDLLFSVIVNDKSLSNSQKCDALQLLCENSDRLAATAIWFLKEVLENPMFSKGLQQDVHNFVDLHGKDVFSAADLHKQLLTLHYFDNCIIEVLRLRPTKANGLSFKIADTLTFDEELICKGSDVDIPFYSLFRQLWIDRPEIYMPHRWHNSHHQSHSLQAVFDIVWGKKNDVDESNPFQCAEMSRLRMLLFTLLYHYDMNITTLGTPHCVETLTLRGMHIAFSHHHHEKQQ